jgi:hypothetical protein
MDSNSVSAFAAVLSVVAVLATVWISYRQSKLSRLERAEDLATRFREPLLQAAYNLQSRLYNIGKQDFLGRFHAAGGASQQERDNAINYTCYLFGQYLAWVEIIRRESQYVDPRSRENNRAIVRKIEHVRDCMASSEQFDDRALRLFRGEQRALGELMLVDVPHPVSDVPRWECLGYAAFVDKLAGDEKYRTWFGPLADGVNVLSESSEFPPRLTAIQHALVDLMDVLDPKSERLPVDTRGRM